MSRPTTDSVERCRHTPHMCHLLSCSDDAAVIIDDRQPSGPVVYRDGYLITQANHAELAINGLRREMSELVKAGADREKLREIEARITDRMASLNRAMEALVP